MSEPQHRRRRRKRGVRVAPTTGRRRSSGTVAASPEPRADITRRDRRRHARRVRGKVVGALLIAVAIVWLTVAITSLLTGREEDSADAPGPEPVPADGASLLIAVTGPDGQATSIGLLAAAEQAAPRLVLLQPSILSTLPGFGENTLANATRFDGIGLLENTVANLLGVRIDAAIALDVDAVTGAVAEELMIAIADPLFRQDGDAQVVVIAPGESLRSADQIARLLTDRGTDDELTWLERQGAVWRAVLEAADPPMIERLLQYAGGDLDAARAALTAAAVDAVVTAVPATRIEPTGGEERYQLSGEVAASFVAESLPYLQLAEEPRVRVEVLNGNGVIGSVRPIAANLIRRGYRIILTDNADRLDYDETRVIAHGRENQESAIAVQDIIGIGQVAVEVRQPSGVVDLTIIVGQDLAPIGG